MLSIVSGASGSQANIYENAATHNSVVSGDYDSLPVHYVLLSIYITWDGSTRTRNLTVTAKETGQDVTYVDVVESVTHTTSGEKTTLAYAFPWTISQGLTITVRSDNTNDDNEQVGFDISSIDPHFYPWILADAGGANSLAQRVQAIDDLTQASGGGDLAAALANQTTLLSRLGAFTGSGVNTVLGFFRALMRKDGGITTPSDVGGAYSHATDSTEAIRDRGDSDWTSGGGATNPNMLLNTTVAAITDQTHFTLTAGSDQDNAYQDQIVVLYDATNNDFPSVREGSAYVGASKTVTLDSAPDFTLAVGDGVKVFVTQAPNVNVLPLSGSPSSSGRITPIKITAYQYTKIAAVLVALDSADNPVDLSGKLLAFCAWHKDDRSTTVITMRTDGGSPELSIGGDDNNQVTIDGGVAHTVNAVQLDWALYNLTDSTTVLRGVLDIEEGVVLPT